MYFALAALRVLGALILGLGLGISALRVMGMIQPDAAGLLVPILVYSVIGGAVLTVAPPGVGVFLLVGWAAPWLLVGWVVATADVIPYLPFPAIVTALYVLALGVAWYRTGRRGQKQGNA